MTPQPTLATFRMVFKYTVLGFQHKLVQYCECVSSADPSGNDIIAHGGFANVGASLVEANIFGALALFYKASDSSFDGYELQRRVIPTTSWAYVYAGPATVTPTGGNPCTKANGVCLSGKDSGNRDFPVYFYESSFSGYDKNSSYSSFSAGLKALIDQFWDVGGVAVTGDAFTWRRSKDDTEGPQRWLSLITDSNQKLRRARRLT